MTSIRLPALLAITVSALWASQAAFAAEVITVAGTGENGYFGDGKLATVAGVGGPFGVVIGPDQALYICETTSHVIRRVDPKNGHISTVVGTGERGNSGDGKLATKAQVDEPYEIRFDRSGNLFFVDMKAACIRRVDHETGRITTVAGTGQEGFAGDGGPAAQSKMKRPHSIALDDAGNLYICDIGNHRIRRVDHASGHITTFAGTGKKQPTPNGAPISGTPLNGPRALDFDGRDLLLALREGNAVYRMNLASMTLHHLAGTGKSGYSGDGGPAITAKLAGPKGVAVGPKGDIYLADTESHTIRVIRSVDGTIETLVGDGQQGDGPDGDPRHCRLSRPHGVHVDVLGNVYIGDSGNHKVRQLIVDR